MGHRKEAGLSLKEMRAEIQKTMKGLGVEVRFDPDKELSSFDRGELLRVEALRAMPDGSVVWVRYREYGERGTRLNRAMRIKKTDDGGWVLQDGSSFASEFYPTDDAMCRDDCGGEGELELFAAVPKKPRGKRKLAP